MRQFISKLCRALTIAAGCWAVAHAGPAWAQSARGCSAADRGADGPRYAVPGDPVPTPAVWSVLRSPIVPVRGSDGRFHLAYVLRFINTRATTVSIDAVSAVDPLKDYAATGTNAVADLQGRSVAGKLRPFAGTTDPLGYVTLLGPGQAGLMYFDVTYAQAEDIPIVIGQQVTQSQPDSAARQPVTRVGGIVPVCPSGEAVVVKPPVRGDHWFNVNGCCAIVATHRTAVLSLNGRQWPAQHYAIDFLQLDETGRPYKATPVS